MWSDLYLFLLPIDRHKTQIKVLLLTELGITFIIFLNTGWEAAIIHQNGKGDIYLLSIDFKSFTWSLEYGN